MTWKYIGNGRSIPGVPMEDMPDDVFDALNALHGSALSECQHKGQVDGEGKPVALEDSHACLLYEHVPDRPERSEKRSAPAAEDET